MAEQEQQSRLPGIGEGERRRDIALRQVEANARDDWKASAFAAIQALTWDPGHEFTSDDVWGILEDLGVSAPHEPRALGAVLQRAKREGYCLPTDRVRASRRAIHHAGPVRIWVAR